MHQNLYTTSFHIRTIAGAFTFLMLFMHISCAIADEVQSEPSKSIAKALNAAPASRKITQYKEIPLPPISAAELADFANKPVTPAKRTGVVRNIESLASTQKILSALNLKNDSTTINSDALRITSPNAKSIRIGFKVKPFPNTAKLIITSGDGTDSQEILGTEINRIVLQNTSDKAITEFSHIIWSKPIKGDTAFVEVKLPNDSNINALPIEKILISHTFDTATLQSLGAASPCNLDVNCYSQEKPKAASVAKISYVRQGYSYTCSGTLMNDKDTTTQKPYFLTAAHCISTQSEASSLSAEWFFESADCNSSNIDSRRIEQSGGARLVAVSPNNDMTLLELNFQPPAGVLYSGWATGSSIGSSVYGIHHPRGDLKKIVFGTVDHYETCDVGEYVTCTQGGNSFLYLRTTRGLTEHGSSGSGLFNSQGQLIGTLSGGNSSCTDGREHYGNFGNAYTVFSPYLNFTPPSYSIDYTRLGDGEGSVTFSAPPNNNQDTCSTNCSIQRQPATYTLTATASTGSTFAGWSGACSGTGTGTGTGTCSINLTNNTVVSARFEKIFTNNTPKIISGASASSQTFAIDVPNGNQKLSIRLTPNSGDPDLFVRFDAPPVKSSPSSEYFDIADCRSRLGTGQIDECIINNPIAGRYFVTVYGYSTYNSASLIYSLTPSTVTRGSLPSNSTVTISGTITTIDNLPVCGLLLINGAKQFTCSPNGQYRLSYPLDNNGNATMFFFASGFTPVRLNLSPTTNQETKNFKVGLAYLTKKPFVSYGAYKHPGNLATVTGWVYDPESAEKLCALILANGVSTYSCSPQGFFEMENVPLDASGNLTIFTFSDSMSPFEETRAPH